MMFIRYPAQFKGYVMYGEHPNGGMIKIDSRNVDFLEDEFPTIGEVKKDVKLFELQQNIQPSFGEGENLNSNQVTEDGMPPLPEGNGGDLSAQKNEIRPRSPIHEESQPASEVHPQSPVAEHSVSHMFGIPHPRGIVEATLHILRVPHLLQKGGMPHPDR